MIKNLEIYHFHISEFGGIQNEINYCMTFEPFCEFIIKGHNIKIYSSKEYYWAPGNYTNFLKELGRRMAGKRFTNFGYCEDCNQYFCVHFHSESSYGLDKFSQTHLISCKDLIIKNIIQ